MNASDKISVGALARCLLRRKTMKERFRLPLTEEQARDVLLAAIEAEVEYRHRTFSDNDDVRNAIRQMTRWLTSDNPKFGMLLCGGCGNGKSTFLKAFQTMLNYLQIPSPYNQGAYGIRIVDAKYASYLCRKDYAEFMRLAGYEMLGLDDLGTEPRELLDFGNVITPVIDLLTKRYDEQLFTIATTNLSPAQIRERYGERIADRLNEMMEKIVFRNETYRKP